jgi:uncharacterized protein (TIGR02217 family)
MSTPFHDVRLPEEVERGSSGGPTFNTNVPAMASGQEQRNINWQNSRATYDISYGIQDRDDYEVCQAFFYARRGKGYGFRFKDWSDFSVEGGLLGLGDGANKTFQLIRIYEDGGPLPYIRSITRPVSGTLTVYVDGSATAAYTLNPLGVVVLDAAPADGVEVTADFEFDVPVRFDVDQFNLALEWSEAGTIGSLPIVELRE